MVSASVLLASILTVAQVLLLCRAQLTIGFYKGSCPNAESIVQGVVRNAYKTQGSEIAPGLVRMHFHDCFVEGCDGSVLLDGPNSEKTAIPNLSLHGFDIIETAKAELEKQCPGIVSCADILAFASRDSIVLAGGLFWNVAAGRLDGFTSQASEALKSLPSPFSNVAQLTAAFAAKGLLQDDMITLSGAHSIGVAHCSSFTNRLYNFSPNSSVDPTLDPQFAAKLQKQCPQGNPNPTTVVPLDSSTSQKFDNIYYTNLVSRKGLLTSDEILFTDPTTKNKVVSNAFPLLNFLYQRKFINSMIKMGAIDVKTGTQGEVRNICSKVNPPQN